MFCYTRFKIVAWYGMLQLNWAMHHNRHGGYVSQGIFEEGIGQLLHISIYYKKKRQSWKRPCAMYHNMTWWLCVT